MANFMCQLGCITGNPDIRSHIVLDASARVFLDEVYSESVD